MSFREIRKIIENSEDYSKFKEKNPESFLSSAFFILNNQFEFEARQLDYFIEKEQKLMSFFLDNSDNLSNKFSEFYNQNIRISKDSAIGEISLDFSDLKKILEEKLKENNQDINKTNKIILVLHKRNKEICWNITCMFSNLKVYSLVVNAIDKKIISEKLSDIYDYIRIDNPKKLK